MFQGASAAAAVALTTLFGLVGTAAAQYLPEQPVLLPPMNVQSPAGAENNQVPPYDPPPVYGHPSEPYYAPNAHGYEPAQAGPQYGAMPGSQDRVESEPLPPPPGTYASPPPPSAVYSSQPPGYEPMEPHYRNTGPDYAVQGSAPAPQPLASRPHTSEPPSRGFLPNPFEVLRPPEAVGSAPQAVPESAVASLPPEDRPESGPVKELPPKFRRTIVDYKTKEPAGTIIIDTPNTYLYLVLGNGKAMRYGIGVGREGFTWSGVERISRMAEWPDWHPPAEMIERQPYLPRFMAGGEGNPLGARALYLGNTLYRIHGTNQPSTIGTFVSSGCIRLTNQDIMDLYTRVQVGTRVVVLPGGKPPATASVATQSQSDATPAGPYNPLAPHAR